MDDTIEVDRYALIADGTAKEIGYGYYVRATDYDALAAKLADAEAERRFILEERDRTFALMLARAEAAEAALPAVYRLALEKCEAACQIEIDRGDKNNASAYAVGARSCQAAIRTLPTPTAAELMARINEGENE